MAKQDPRIDAYIKKSADFAQPVLNHFRALVHKVCPDVEETVKWGMPSFGYKSQIMCHMAAFKQHAVIGFWKAALMQNGKDLVEMAKTEEAMGHLGKLTSVKDLPKDSQLIKYIKEAMRLNEEGVKVAPKTKPGAAKPVEVPDYFLKTLSKNKKALKAFDEFSNSHKNEYVQWITEAKTEPTREKRMAEAVKMLSEGKSRNWKYEKK